VLVVGLKNCCFLVAQGGWTFGHWTDDGAFASSVVLAIVLGHLLALFAHRNWYHQFLCDLKLSSRTSYPSEWFSAFTRYQKLVVLHLDDGRRLHGWASEWPDHPDSGHFVLTHPHLGWVLEDNTFAAIVVDESLLIAANAVSMVEFVKSESVRTELQEIAEESERKLIELNKREIEEDSSE